VERIPIYCADSRAGKLMFLAGLTGKENEGHDWYNLVDWWGLLLNASCTEDSPEQKTLTNCERLRHKGDLVSLGNQDSRSTSLGVGYKKHP
jgi:hypothetical protein